MRKIRICFCMLLTLIMGLEGIGFPYTSVEAAATTVVQIKIGDTNFQASFEDNKTTKALFKKFPVTYTMSELNGNEKYKYLSYELPKNAKQVKTIHAGDIMLYGTDCIVLFYKDFKTSYSYTRLGRITDPSGLEKAVKKGKIKVQFSIPKKKIRLNKKKITLTKGSSFQLKLIGGKAKKVKWSVQNKKIATVKNGRIKAKKKGKTRIVAIYKKKKYVCKLTVTEKSAATAKPKETADATKEPVQTEEPKETPDATKEPVQTEEPKETPDATKEPVQTEEPKETPGITEEPVQTEEPQEEGEYMMKMKIDDVEVSVAWEDNESVRELKKIAGNGEIKISMSMYGGFEQVGSLGTNISRQDVQMRTEPGDIVLYSGNQMVVFYGSNTWAYTRLGKIQGLTSEELKNLLGTGNVTITIFAHS
ncbi:Ig-like domain (group 2) [Lachnospiraceae bacterium]|nr:Ig-like domain (group 2) [Lachnospiraceae bacterium]